MLLCETVRENIHSEILSNNYDPWICDHNCIHRGLLC